MPTDINRIIDFIIKSFIHVWPYLLLSIPLAVGVKMSGASRYIKRAFDGHPATAILLAVAVGAFSPFCSMVVSSAELQSDCPHHSLLASTCDGDWLTNPCLSRTPGRGHRYRGLRTPAYRRVADPAAHTR